MYIKRGNMAFSIDDNGNIKPVQGDSGTLTISGLDTTSNYTVWRSLSNLFSEICCRSAEQPCL